LNLPGWLLPQDSQHSSSRYSFPMDPSSSFRASTSTETQSSPDDTAPFIKYAINHQSSSARTTTFGRRVLAIRKYFGSQCKTISRSLIRSAIQTKEVLRRQRSRVRVTMSLFSRLRSARKAVRERRARSKKQDDGKEVSKDKYRHVPTHAAVDALSGAPSAWKLEDQSKIKEFHLRRSELVLRCHETTVLSGGGRTPLLKKPSYLSRNSSLLTEGSQKASFNSSEDELLIPSIPSLGESIHFISRR
jgi:hypothetical protein